MLPRTQVISRIGCGHPLDPQTPCAPRAAAMAASVRSSSTPPSLMTLSSSTARTSGTSSRPGDKCLAMPARVLGKLGEWSSSAQSGSDDKHSNSSSSLVKQDSSSDGVTPVKPTPKPTPPGSHGTPAAGSCRIDIASSSASNASTTRYDDQQGVLDKLANPGAVVTTGNTPNTDETQQHSKQQQQQCQQQQRQPQQQHSKQQPQQHVETVKTSVAMPPCASAAMPFPVQGTAMGTKGEDHGQTHVVSRVPFGTGSNSEQHTSNMSDLARPVLPVVSAEPRHREGAREPHRHKCGAAASRSSSFSSTSRRAGRSSVVGRVGSRVLDPQRVTRDKPSGKGCGCDSSLMDTTAGQVKRPANEGVATPRAVRRASPHPAAPMAPRIADEVPIIPTPVPAAAVAPRTAGVGDHAPSMDSDMVSVEARIAQFEREFAARMNSTQQQHDAHIQSFREQLRIAENVASTLRAEVAEYDLYGKSEVKAAHLANHELSDFEFRAMNEARGMVMNAVGKTEVEAERRHNSTIAQLKSELSSALSQHHVGGAGIQPPCPNCPIMQSRIDGLSREIDSMKVVVTTKDQSIAELQAQLQQQQQQIQQQQQQSVQQSAVSRDQLQQANAEIDRLRAAVSASKQELEETRRQAAEAQSGHAAREAEVSGHADSLSAELEMVKRELAATKRQLDNVSRSGDELAGIQLKLVQQENEHLRSEMRLLERLNAALEKGAAMPSNRSTHARSSNASVVESYNIGDDGDNTSDDDDDGDDYGGDWTNPPGNQGSTLAGGTTRTATQLQKPAAAASRAGSSGGGGGGGGGGKPPRQPSGGGDGSDKGSQAGYAGRRKGHGGGGGGDDDPPDDDDGDGDDGNGGNHRNRRSTYRDDGWTEVTRKKEGDDVKIGNLPRNAAEYQPWMDNVVDAVTACARDTAGAFAWIARVEQDDTTFEDLGMVEPHRESLDAKIRVSMSKHTTGHEAEKNRELVSTLVKRRDELKKAMPPTQITGRQLLFVVRKFYQIHEKERVQYELSSLMDLDYPGDAQMGPFKDRWDHMVRHLRTKLSDHDKEGILVKKLRKSESLKPHLEYYDRMPDDHADHCYNWVSQLVDKLVADNRRRRNTESLVLDASGKEQRQKKPGAPGPRKEPPSGKAPPGGSPDGPTKPHKGKGDGKGKGKDRKKRAQGGGAASDTESDGGYATDQFPGKAISEIPEADRCCVFYLWARKDGKSQCKNARNGKACKYPHCEKPSKAMLDSKLYAKYSQLWGKPNGPAKPASGDDDK